MYLKRLLVVGALCGASALAGCGGGGGSSSALPGPNPTPTIPSNIPGVSTLNSNTSYTVYSGTLNGATFLQVAPLGDTGAVSNLSGATPVPGAVIQYPDGSTQVADVLGDFDASQSSWATANNNAVISNPSLEPEVIVFNPGTSALPADAYVATYSTSNNPTTAANMRRIASGTAATTELSGVAVFPRGYALFDSENRIYHAVGADSNGTFTSLSGATVTWSLSEPAGCANAGGAGKLTAVPGDQTRIVYSPPSSGTFGAGCQDIINASVSASGANYSGSGNAFYYDPSTAVTLQGVLNDSTGKPVANGLVDLYGGGREFYHGKLYAIADSSGNFKRLVPSQRTLYPFGGNPTTTAGKTTYSFFAVNPQSIPVGAGGSSTTQNLAETSVAAVNPFKPLPPLEHAIRDSWLIGDLAQDQFPFGEAQSGGTFAAGTIEAVLQNPSANASGTISKGNFSGWTYQWDSTAKIAVFQQPATQENGRHAMQVTLAGATMQYAAGGSTACPANNTCYNYTSIYNPAGLSSALPSPIGTAPAGTILAQDGSFAQNVSGGTVQGSNFNVNLTRNVYSVGHQTAGSPLYTHTIAYSETPGSLASSATDTWLDASGKQLASVSFTRTPGSGTAIFTYSGSGTRLFYKPDGTLNFQVAFTLNGGTLNKDHSGGFNVVFVSGLPNASDNGTSVTWTFPGSGGNRASGKVDNPNVTGLTSPDVATFSVSPAYLVTVTTDASLGGNVISFHL